MGVGVGIGVGVGVGGGVGDAVGSGVGDDEDSDPSPQATIANKASRATIVRAVRLVNTTVRFHHSIRR